jgi:hypothetical protein
MSTHYSQSTKERASPFHRNSILSTKGGLVGTYQTFMGFHPDTEVGIVVLTSYGPNTTENPETLGTSILTDFIPVVEAANFAIISPSYTGVYICEHTAPILSPDLNETVEVLHGPHTSDWISFPRLASNCERYQ